MLKPKSRQFKKSTAAQADGNRAVMGIGSLLETAEDFEERRAVERFLLAQ